MLLLLERTSTAGAASSGSTGSSGSSSSRSLRRLVRPAAACVLRCREGPCALYKGFLPKALQRRSRFGTPIWGVVLSSTGVLILATMSFVEIVTLRE